MNPSCDGKTKFSSMRIAQRAAHRKAKRHHTKMTAYHCEECHGFHVGSSTGKPRDHRKELKYAEAQ